MSNRENSTNTQKSICSTRRLSSQSYIEFRSGKIQKSQTIRVTDRTKMVRLDRIHQLEKTGKSRQYTIRQRLEE